MGLSFSSFNPARSKWRATIWCWPRRRKENEEQRKLPAEANFHLQTTAQIITTLTHFPFMFRCSDGWKTLTSDTLHALEMREAPGFHRRGSVGV